MIKSNIGKKQQKQSILGGLFGGRSSAAGEVSLFGNKKVEKHDKEGSSFYGGDEDDGDSFNSSYYDTGGASGGAEERKKGTESKARLAFLRYLGWMEYVVIAIEIFLIVYTFLVLLNLAPLF